MKTGSYWLGTLHGVININPKTNSRKVFDSDSKDRILLNNVFAVEKDYSGNIWIGTAGGINIWDGKSMHEVTAGENGLTSNYIARFVKGPGQTMWVGAWEGGIFRISGEVPDLTFERVNGINGSEKVVAGPYNLWTVEFDELYRINPETLEKKHVPAFGEASAKQMIYCLYVSANGVVWAGSLNGLVRYDPVADRASFHSFNTGVDLTITSIMEDLQGNIWSSSNTSIQNLEQTLHLLFFPLTRDYP